MEKTTATQMKQLLKKLHTIQLQYIGTIDGLSFNVSFMTNKNYFERIEDSIHVSILIGSINETFTFYQFFTIEENQSALDNVRKLLNKIAKQKNINEDVFK